MKISFNKLLTLLLLLLLQQTISLGQADITLLNGKIFTSDTSRLYVEALAIKGNKILAVGTNKEIKKFTSAKTKVIDLKGKTVVPGFNDAHDHLAFLFPTGKTFYSPFSIPGISKQDVIDSLVRLVKEVSPGQWISGPIGLTVLNDTSFRRKFLDSISPENPVVLEIAWGHGMIVNSKALEVTKISATAVDPVGGWYERTKGTGLITGAMYENAQFPFWQALAIAEPTNLMNALHAHASEELAFGITTVQNMSSTMQGNAALKYFTQAQLPVRTRIIAMPGSTASGRSLEEWNPIENKRMGLTYISGIKYIIDGTSSEQNSLKTTSYPGRPSWYGRLNFPIDSIKQILQESLQSKRQLMLHITGDSATNLVLRLMKEMASDEVWRKKRVRIEHGVGIKSDYAVNAVKALGIIIVHTPQYGKNSPINTWTKMGIPVAIGPDGLINPYLNIMTVTTGQSKAGENITREQAVIAYTLNSAYAEFTDKVKGTLTPGKLADISVLSQDIFTIPATTLPSVRSVLTIVDGRIVHQQ
jgi:predicted amidohydrolase YtcJ